MGWDGPLRVVRIFFFPNKKFLVKSEPIDPGGKGEEGRVEKGKGGGRGLRGRRGERRRDGISERGGEWYPRPGCPFLDPPTGRDGPSSAHRKTTLPHTPEVPAGGGPQGKGPVPREVPVRRTVGVDVGSRDLHAGRTMGCRPRVGSSYVYRVVLYSGGGIVLSSSPDPPGRLDPSSRHPSPCVYGPPSDADHSREGPVSGLRFGTRARRRTEPSTVTHRQD